MCLENYRKLAKVIETPPMFIDVLPLIITPDEVDILLTLAEERSPLEVSRSLELPLEITKSRLNNLFLKGFLKKKGREDYVLRSFDGIINRYLSEGRAASLGRYTAALANYKLEGHVGRAGRASYPGSRVLTIPEALEPVTVIFPYETALDILKRAEFFSIRDC